MKSDEATKDCFLNYENRFFKIDEMQIFLDNEKMIFEVSFGLGSACFSVDGTQIEIPLKLLEKYLK